MLNKKDFNSVVKLSPMASIDFIIWNDKHDKILLGKRTNKPAQDYFFTFGGRINKNELWDDAIARISFDEFGVKLTPKDLMFKGIFQHIYHDNYFNDDFGTHYINVAYEYFDYDKLVDVKKMNQPKKGNSYTKQHGEFKWFGVDELFKSKEVHQNVKNYFDEDKSFNY